jgi:hypothetical protein
MDKYKDWDIFNEMPDGWVLDKTAGSPAPNAVFITNGKSVLNGQKRALLTIQKEPIPFVSKAIESAQEVEPKTGYIFPVKTVNQLARERFKEQLLKEIMFDLMVCEVEGWDKRQYVEELKELINSINT